MTQRRVMFIALDATEKSLIEQWMREGDLPHLSRLREQGTYGDLESHYNKLNATTWPTLTTGVWPGEHGINNPLMWRPERATFQRPTADWVGIDPFWFPLGVHGRNVIALDIPYSHLAIHPRQDIELRNWGSQYRFGKPKTHPPDLMRTIARQEGRVAFSGHQSGLKRIKQMMPIREELIASVGKQLNIGRKMLQSYPWDLFMLCFGAPHLGGHEFWDTSGLLDTPNESESELFATTIRDIYRACDAALGELIKFADEQTSVVVISPYGMGANDSLADMLPDMVSRVMSDIDDGEVAESGLLRDLRERVPVEWRSAVKNRLPTSTQDWLSAYWRNQTKYDWASVEAFCPPPDIQGYVRINLQGREANGIVAPGENYDALWRRISAGLKTFVDDRTGLPIIEQIRTPDQLFPPGDRLQLLPDLIVQWSGVSAKEVRSITSAEYGTLQWPTPGKVPDGQSGHHVSDGWIMASGTHIEPGSTIDTAHLIDVAPTIYKLMHESIPAHLQGKAIEMPGSLA